MPRLSDAEIVELVKTRFSLCDLSFNVPDGFRVKDIRRAEPREQYVDDFGNVKITNARTNCTYLIVEPTMKRIVYTPVVEDGKPSFRPARDGEYYIDRGIIYCGCSLPDRRYPIYTRTVEEVPIPQEPSK